MCECIDVQGLMQHLGLQTTASRYVNACLSATAHSLRRSVEPTPPDKIKDAAVILAGATQTPTCAHIAQKKL